MRLDITYRMHFRYSKPVRESQNEVRVRPRHDRWQRVLSSGLAVQPAARVLQAHDYWGTSVDHLGIRTEHPALELVAESSVETLPRPTPAADAPLAALADFDFRSAHFEYLEPSEHVRWWPGDGVAERAAAAAKAARSAREVLAAVQAEVRGALRYEPETTDIGVSLADLLAGGVGVCQDFAHLAIGMLRCSGVPARYVSGYLFAADETSTAQETAEVVSVQTHAWVEAALPGVGWCSLDPTNGGQVGERHVVIGHGRDYGDVPPVRGAFMGTATAEVEAEVVIGRLPESEPQASAGPNSRPRVLVQEPASVARSSQFQQQQ